MEKNSKVPLLDVKNISVKFRMYDNKLKAYDLPIINNIDLSLFKGEIIAIAGASGSGKSLFAHSVMGILPENAEIKGDIYYSGKKLTLKDQAKLRGKEIAFVPQSVSYLDPLMKIGEQVKGVYGTKDKQEQAFKRLNLDEAAENKYPFQLSGGMARRALVGSAIISDATLIIADEPTPGLTPELAKEAMQIFREFADEGKAVIIITHDIDLAFSVADKIAVFYAGMIVEIAPVKDFIQGGLALRHPYSRALCRALPQNEFEATKCSQPYQRDASNGCPFVNQCENADKLCLDTEKLTMKYIRNGKVLCCHAT